MKRRSEEKCYGKGKIILAIELKLMIYRESSRYPPQLLSVDRECALAL